jgi:hypothetical protein
MMKRFRSYFYLMIACTLLLYGMPRFHLHGFTSLAEGFALIWTCFALLVIGAHLYDIMVAGNDAAHHVEPNRQKQKIRAHRF